MNTSYKRRPLLASYDACTACMACVNSCSFGALDLSVDADGYHFIDFNADKCVLCGQCTRHCPEISLKERPKIHPQAYAVWCKEDELRKRSSSGGAFAAIARNVISQGGIAYGASIDGFTIKHMGVESETELHHLQGSKYQLSENHGIYREIANVLKTGRIVLYSGLSCQIAGLYAYLGKRYDNLYTIDTICGGVSTILPMDMLKSTGEYAGIVSFRDKDKGWRPKGFGYNLKMKTKSGEVKSLSHKNPVIASFNSKHLKRSSCLDCHYNGKDRLADCTICDFWGLTDYESEHYAGVSGLIVNDDRIMTLLDSSGLELHQCTLADIIKTNPCYYWGNYSFYLKSSKRSKLLSALRDKNEYGFNEVMLAKPSFRDRLMFKIRELQRERALKKLTEATH